MRRAALTVAPALALLQLTAVPAAALERPQSALAVQRPDTVRMTDALRFVPARITVRAGQRIVWRNVGGIAHTVTTLRSKASNRNLPRVPRGARPWNSGFVFDGERYSRTLRVAGLYRYFCIPHEGARMIGTIVVRP